MRPYILLAALVFASIVPFASRAVSLDEHIYLRLARSALTNPLFPADTPALFFGIERSTYIGHTHPPVGEYYLAALYALLGRFDETTFRLLFAVFPITAVLAFFALAKRFTAKPFFVTLLLAVSPAFFVHAPTLMMDIPMMAFLLLGFAFYFSGRLIPAAISFTLAVGTGYSAIVPLACLGLIMLLSRRSWKELACVLAAPVALVLWLIAMTLHFGEFPLTQMSVYLVLQGVTPKTTSELVLDRTASTIVNSLAILSFLGGVSVFPGMVRLRLLRSWLGSLGLSAALSFLAPMPSLLYRLWFVVLVTCGIMLLAAFAGSASRIMRERNGGEAVLILWAPAVLLFFAVVGELITARYLLLALPAIYLVVFRESSRADLIATIIPTAVLSVILGYADFRFVNANRAWVQATVPALQEQGFQIYSATESGLRFYLENRGVQTLSQTDLRPKGSDLIISHSMFGYGLAPGVGEITSVLKRFKLEDWFPVRTFGPAAHAGFYDRHFGLVPYVISSEPYDEIQVTQVNPIVKRLPQSSTNPEEAAVWSPDGPIFKQSQKERVFPMTFPTDINIEYELEGGVGSAEQTAEGLRLLNVSGTTLTWRRLRFMPKQFVGAR